MTLTPKNIKDRRVEDKLKRELFTCYSQMAVQSLSMITLIRSSRLLYLEDNNNTE